MPRWGTHFPMPILLPPCLNAPETARCPWVKSRLLTKLPEPIPLLSWLCKTSISHPGPSPRFPEHTHSFLPQSLCTCCPLSSSPAGKLLFILQDLRLLITQSSFIQHLLHAKPRPRHRGSHSKQSRQSPALLEFAF